MTQAAAAQAAETADAAAAAAPDDDPEAMFDEMADSFTWGAQGEPASEDAGDDPEPDSEDDAAADAAAKDAADDDGEDGDKADGPEAKAADDDGEPDIWANATPEQKAEIERLRHSEASQRGRVSALMRQQNQRSQPPAPAAGADGKHEGATSPFEDPEFQTLEKDYPEIAGPVKKLVGSMMAENANLKKELSSFSDERRQEYYNSQVDVLNDAHPGWTDITGSDAFSDWLDGQPEYVRQAAVRNGETIVDGAEAAHLIGQFKAQTGYAAPPAKNGKADEPGADKDADTKPNASKTPKTKARRSVQLDSAREAPRGTQGIATRSGIPEDGEPEEIFDAFERQGAFST